MTQVITIAPDGSMSGLQVKPGKGVDLRQFGKASIKRASEVLFDEDKQMWFVEIRSGKYAGQKIDYDFHAEKMGYKLLECMPYETAFFEEYEDAVACEIEVLDAIRLREGPHVL